MIVTRLQLAQAIKEILYASLIYLPREEKAETVTHETELTISQCKEAMTFEVRRLLQELDLQMEPPDINDPKAIREFIEELSKRNFTVNYSF